MTATEIARRSDALYEDNSGGMTRRTLCDMVAQREAEIEKLRELEDENARLRSCLSDDAENARMIMAENAKLRLLVEGMATYERMDTDADPLRALEIKGAIRQLASELGVEL